MPRVLVYAERWFRAAYALAALAILIRLVPVLGPGSNDPAQLADAIYDDGYFYLTIAANLVETGRSTLDGITATNGYQPLWLLLLAGLAAVVGTAPVTLLKATCVLVAFIALLGLSPWRREPDAQRRAQQRCALTGLALMLVGAGATFLDGLETVLMLPCAVPLMRLLERARTPREDLLLSLLFALAFLIRLDALALFPAVLLVQGLFPLPEARLDARRVLRLSAVLLPTVLAYAAVNLALFGIAVPVSGLAKAVGGPVLSNWGILVQPGRAWTLLGLALAGLAALEWLAAGTRPEACFRRSIAVLLLALGVQQVYYAAFSLWQLFSWYDYLLFLALAAVLARCAWLVAHLHAARRHQLPVLAGLLMLMLPALADARALKHLLLPGAPLLDADPALRVLPHETGKRVDLRLVDSLFAKLPASRLTVAMGDIAGALAYWGRHRLDVVQLEGLTLDADYIRARRAERGNAYFDQRYAIDYLVVDRSHVPRVARADGGQEYVVADPVVGRVVIEPVPLFCFPESAVVWRHEHVDGGLPYTSLVFRYAARQPCSAESEALIAAVRAGAGLRQLSLQPQYAAGYADPVAEDRDRALAHRIARWLQR